MESAVHIYRKRGEQFADAMRLCRGDAAFTGAVALLAVHSSISYNDAVYLKLTGKRHRSDDHKRAASDTRIACNQLGLPVEGISHLQKLVKYKTRVSYGEERVGEELVEMLCVSAERFEFWAAGLLGTQAG